MCGCAMSPRDPAGPRRTPRSPWDRCPALSMRRTHVGNTFSGCMASLLRGPPRPLPSLHLLSHSRGPLCLMPIRGPMAQAPRRPFRDRPCWAPTPAAATRHFLAHVARPCLPLGGSSPPPPRNSRSGLQTRPTPALASVCHLKSLPPKLSKEESDMHSVVGVRICSSGRGVVLSPRPLWSSPEERGSPLHLPDSTHQMRLVPSGRCGGGHCCHSRVGRARSRHLSPRHPLPAAPSSPRRGPLAPGPRACREGSQPRPASVHAYGSILINLEFRLCLLSAVCPTPEPVQVR